MKKKIIGILVCMMLVAMIPVAAGLNCDTETAETKFISNNGPEPEGILGRTILRGIILFPRATRDGDFKFFAVRIHYTTISLGGVKSGTKVLQGITLPSIPNGFIGNFYLFGSFRGNLDA